MNTDPNQFVCLVTERAPPVGVPLAIYAISTEGFNEWFEGDFDGDHWRTRDLPATPPEWYVRGWRPIDAAPEGELHDCRTLDGPPSAGEPVLRSVDSGA